MSSIELNLEHMPLHAYDRKRLLARDELAPTILRMANKKKTLKGKRYTPEEKEQILSFVRDHNSEHGRGGVTAATKQFGASALSISGWLKSGGQATSGTSKQKGATGSAQGRSKVLDQLATLDREIYARRKELVALEAKFEKLKGSL